MGYLFIHDINGLVQDHSNPANSNEFTAVLH